MLKLKETARSLGKVLILAAAIIASTFIFNLRTGKFDLDIKFISIFFTLLFFGIFLELFGERVAGMECTFDELPDGTYLIYSRVNTTTRHILRTTNERNQECFFLIKEGIPGYYESGTTFKKIGRKKINISFPGERTEK
jgi:hypothetical protein